MDQSDSPRSKPSHLELGRKGEDAAAESLVRAGYRLLRRNWDGGRGRYEIDIVAEHRDQIVFVEVKTRSPSSLRSPESAVDDRKRQRIRRAAAAFLSRYREPSAHRFDIVSVYLDQDSHVLRVEIHESAFD